MRTVLLLNALLAIPEQLPPCVSAPAPAASGETLRVTVYRGSGVDPSDVDHAMRDVGRVLGVHVQKVAEHSLPLGTLLTTTDLPSDGSDGLEPLADTLLKPVKDFLRGQPPDDGTVHLVVVRRLLARDAALRRYFSSLDGLTFSPLLERALPRDSPTAQLHRALGVPHFAPTVFLGVDELRTAHPFTAAHELGHALGLPHVDNVDNLMSPQRRAGCEPSLDGRQRALLAAAVKELRP